MPRDPFYLMGLEGHQCVFLCVHLTVSLRLKAFGCVPFVHFLKCSEAVNTVVACTCVQDCSQCVHMAPVLGEAQECEISRCFVEGDNEQSAILTG